MCHKPRARQPIALQHVAFLYFFGRSFKILHGVKASLIFQVIDFGITRWSRQCQETLRSSFERTVKRESLENGDVCFSFSDIRATRHQNELVFGRIVA